MASDMSVGHRTKAAPSAPAQRQARIEASLQRVEARLARLEATLSSLDALMTQAPGLVAMVADMGDEMARAAAQRGVSIEERLPAAIELAETLTEPQTMEALGKLAQSAKVIEPIVSQAPGVAAMAADMLDEWTANAAAQGIDIEARLNAVLGLALKATEPQNLQALDALLDRSDRLVEALKMADSLPGLMAMGMDMLDESIAKANAQGLSIPEVGRKLIAAGLGTANLIQRLDVEALINSGIFDPKTLDVVGRAGRAMVDVRQEKDGKAGAWAAFKATRDPDVQRALDFGLRFGRRFGQLLKKQLP